jgi:hypothetical protein
MVSWVVGGEEGEEHDLDLVPSFTEVHALVNFFILMATQH